MDEVYEISDEIINRYNEMIESESETYLDYIKTEENGYYDDDDEELA